MRRFLTDTDVPCGLVPDVFTDYHGDIPTHALRQLRATCRNCPVLPECREYVLSVEEDVAGFAAGMTPRERQQVRRVAS